MNDESRPVDLRKYQLETHVEAAFRVALNLAAGQAINARHTLEAAVIVSRTASSRAFEELASLLSLPDPDAQPTGETPDANLGELLLHAALAASFSTAERFFQQAKAVWGRDYVTFALLAADPSLGQITENAYDGLATLRDVWFEFVTSTDEHRGRDGWEEWWRGANVPLPHERIISPSGQTYLLTWDPARSPFGNVSAAARRAALEGSATITWSVGHRDISPGDRVFFMRHGDGPRGLIGSGMIASDPFEANHWDRKGATTFYAGVLLDHLQESPRVSLEDLVAYTGEPDLWTMHGSGLFIPQGLAEKLQELWEAPDAESIEPAPLAWVETDRIPAIGERDDRLSEHDCLDVEQQADIFATLLITQDVRAPLALGLLGDWGVGKTFFMRLMQEKIAAVAGKQAKADTGSDSVSRVAQIEFNAWHYIDSDLWASLASHIFDSLSEELQTEKEGVKATRRRLRRTIDSSQRECEEANNAKNKAEKSLRSAAESLADNQAARARAAADHDEHRFQRLWAAVLRVKPDPDKPEEADWPDLAKLVGKAQGTANRLGITGAIDSVQKARRVQASLLELHHRGSALAAAFASTFTGAHAWISIPLLVGLLLLVLGWPYLLTRIEGLSEAAEGFASGIVAPLLQLFTLLGPPLVWAGSNLKSISSAIGYLEQVQEELCEPRVPPVAPGKEEQALQKQIEELDEQIAGNQRQIEEAEKQITLARAEIQRINAGGLVYDFLEGRVRDSRYLDRLGLISVIRQDFDKLGSLLRDWRKHGPYKGDDKTPPAAVTWDTRPVDRIILYIDDLDRCPPKRVVEVLQAVHLLLAFDLFIVVVAVDPRWLERSLNETYNPGSVTADGETTQEPIHQFSAHNYLEKIFQIPFSLPAMNEDGYRKLVGGLITRPRIEAERRQARGLQEPDRPEATEVPETGASPGDDIQRPPDEGAPEFTAKEKQEREEAERRRREQEEAERRKREQEEAERKKREQERAQERIRSMLLHAGEEQFIAALYRFIETPRLAKRFINVYRLLRVRIWMLEEDFSTFTDYANGEYRAVLMLLAICVGNASVAPDILDDLCESRGDSFQAGLEDLVRRYEAELSRLKAEREAQKDVAPPSSREKRLAELCDSLAPIRADIDAVKAALERHGGPAADDGLAAYRKWAREVGRYSFRWHIQIDT